MVFPSCAPCNRGTSSLDTIVSWLGRIYPDPDSRQEREEVADLGRSMIVNFPEVASGFYGDPRPMSGEDFARLGTRSVTPINVDDLYIHRAVQYFGAKVGFALHWKETGEPLSRSGRVYSRWMTNAQAIRGMLPPNLFRLFPEPEPLRQGRMKADGFWYSTRRVGDLTSHLAIFGRSFITISIASPEPAPEMRAEETLVECEPGCFKQGYPFGLPKLTPEEIEKRFDRLRNS